MPDSKPGQPQRTNRNAVPNPRIRACSPTSSRSTSRRVALPPNLDLNAAEVKPVYRNDVLWSRSYCAVTCGSAPRSVISQYVEQQGMPN
ncbi:MAG TPA: transposase [Xanthobacteraceae bacterium]